MFARAFPCPRHRGAQLVQHPGVSDRHVVPGGGHPPRAVTPAMCHELLVDATQRFQVAKWISASAWKLGLSGRSATPDRGGTSSCPRRSGAPRRSTPRTARRSRAASSPGAASRTPRVGLHAAGGRTPGRPAHEAAPRERAPLRGRPRRLERRHGTSRVSTADVARAMEPESASAASSATAGRRPVMRPTVAAVCERVVRAPARPPRPEAAAPEAERRRAAETGASSCGAGSLPAPAVDEGVQSALDEPLQRSRPPRVEEVRVRVVLATRGERKPSPPSVG